jgi:hypothetical protein
MCIFLDSHATPFGSVAVFFLFLSANETKFDLEESPSQIHLR